MLSYFLIFIAKLVEVALATIRNVLINRGEKARGAFIGFFEVMIWVLVVNQVLSGLGEDPLKLIVYCLAFSCGNYVGVIIEDKLAIGMACIQVLVSDEKKKELSIELRNQGFGVTVLKGEGKDQVVDVLMIFLKRKRVSEASELIKKVSPKSIIVVNDVRNLKNGFLRK